MHRATALSLCVLALVFGAGCGEFDDEAAALQIRQAFCEGWPYGCTENTAVEIGEVQQTPHGWQVEFKVVDGDDETAKLKAAYLERNGDEWKFMFFEAPFSQQFSRETSRAESDRREFKEQLMDLKAAQRWFASIYGRFARDLAELDSVSYKPPPRPITLTLADDGDIWRGEVESRYVRCVLEVPTQQLPVCEPLASAPNAGRAGGPLSTAFGQDSER